MTAQNERREGHGQTPLGPLVFGVVATQLPSDRSHRPRQNFGLRRAAYPAIRDACERCFWDVVLGHSAASCRSDTARLHVQEARGRT